MKMQNIVLTGIVCLTTSLNALAGFTPPTEAQIEAAAANPSGLSALLNGATPVQASHVVKTVMARVAALNLSDEALASRINLVMGTTLSIVSTTNQVSFATMLGTEMGNSLAIRSQPSLVSAAQGALTTGAGTAGAAVATAFGEAFSTASSGSSNSQNTRHKDAVKPPSAGKYPGQN